MTHVPIIRFDHLSEAQKRAYVIADNKIAEQAGWGREILALELGELIDLLPIEDLDVSLTGFEAAEIDLLMADARRRRTRSSRRPQTRLRFPAICGSSASIGSSAGTLKSHAIS
jgi:hypothetical protein